MPGHANLSLTVCGRMTSAAPSYFAPVPLSTPTHRRIDFVDGGISRNNPAYAFIQDLGRSSNKEFNLNNLPDKLLIVSIGTGLPPSKAPNINSLPLGASVRSALQTATETEISHANLMHLLIGHPNCIYYRLQPPIHHPYKLDECDRNALNVMRFIDITTCDRSTVDYRDAPGNNFDVVQLARDLLG